MSISVQPALSSQRAGIRPAAGSRSYGQAIIMAVSWFNLVLCFINTEHWTYVTATHVAAVQVLLLLAAGVMGRNAISRPMVAYALLVVATVVALKLINPALDLKILFDMAVGPAFVLLGMQSTVPQTNIILRNLLIAVVAVGIIEMAFTNWYERVFDIWSYYVNKGTVDENTLNFTGTSFFTSGERSEQAGRTLLGGVLGPHRASSIFLEPVSMGNFPIVCLAWLLSVRLPKGNLRIALFALTVACIVLPDSRFASACCILMVLLRLTGWHRSVLLAAALPFAVAMAMWLVGSVALSPGEFPRILSDDLGGRLLFSSKLLAYWNWSNWFAFTPSPVYVQDTGYAYVVSALGLPITALIWLGFALAPVLSPEAAAMRGMIAVYYASSLAINNSIFSVKTAALLWFLYGAAQAAGAARRAPEATRRWFGRPSGAY